MSNNLLDALKLLEPQTIKKFEFRLYYNKETGEPLFYTMDEETGDYIIVTKEQFAECRYDIRIKNNKIEKVQFNAIGKLVPNTKGYGTLRQDVSIVGNEVYWSLKTYD